tara:strand:- start:458 stop:1861 length:1404 start_codon:yes stop_codon:yes gene_type:complete
MIKFLIRIVLVTSVVSIFLYYFQPQSIFFENDLKRIVEKNKVTFVTRLGPTTYYEIKNKKFGYHYSIMKEFADFIDVELSIKVVNNIADARKMISSRDADIVSGWNIVDLGQDIKTSYPYNRVDYVIVAKSNISRRSNIEDKLLNNDIHAIESHVITNIDTKREKKLKYSYKIWQDKNIDDLLRMLNDNEIIFLLMSSDEFKILSKYYRDIKVVQRHSVNEAEYWVLPYNVGSDLQNKISEFFNVMIDNNRLAIIYRNFFGQQQHTFVGSKIFIKDLIEIFPTYEFFFKEASRLFNFDWKLIASIGYQESRWKKDAVSYTGVKGIMMLTKDTAREVGVEDRKDPKESIFGGVKYLRTIYNRIDYDLDDKEKIWFAIAAYNIGLGHVEDAIKLAASDGVEIRKWSDIEPYILMLSQSEYYRQTKYGYARGWETVKYVKNIKQYYDIIVFLDSQDKEVDEKDQEIPKTL